MRELVLSVKRKAFRDEDDYSADNDFKQERESVIQRDNNTCQYCGDKYEKYMEVHHLDDDHTNNDSSNLITACCLCHAVNHIGCAGAQGRGVIAYLPEFTQVQINRAYKLMMAVDPKYGMSNEVGSNIKEFIVKGWNEANNTAQGGVFIQDRITKVSDVYSKHWMSAQTLGELLSSLDDEKYNQRTSVLHGLRLIPISSGYTDQATYWAGIYSKNKPVKNWETLVLARANDGDSAS